MRKALLAIPVLAIALSGCGTAVPPDNMSMKYSGGSVEGAKFLECKEPGKVADPVFNDENIFLMTSERTWNIAKEGGDTNTPIEASTKPDDKGNPGPKVHVWLKVDFFLNTNCDGGKDSVVVKWWETLGRRYGADVDGGASSAEQSKDEGWKNSLLNSLVPPITRSIQDSARSYIADDLDSGANGSWSAMESQIESTLSTDLNANGSFYCGPGYSRDKPDNCPPLRVTITDINYADGKVAEARAAVFAAELEAKKRLIEVQQEAARRTIEAQGKLNESRLLAQIGNDPLYLQIKVLENELARVQACASNPNCTIIMGTNPNLNINTKK